LIILKKDYNLRIIYLNCLNPLIMQSNNNVIIWDNKLQTRPLNLWAYDLTKRICNRVRQIMAQIHKANEKNSNICMNPTSERLINFSMERLDIRWYWLDKLLTPASQNEALKYIWEDMISLVIYNDDNQIEFANNAYLKAAGLSSIEEMHGLSRKWELYNEIYEWKALKRANFLTEPEAWEIRRWYTDEIFPMKKTWRILRWSSKKNVRIWIDVTDIEWYENLPPSLEMPIDKKFKYNYLVNNFNMELNQIIETVSGLKDALEKHWIKAELDKNFDMLKKISQIGDTIIDFWPLPVFFLHDNEMFINKRYMEMTSYEYNELYDFMNTWNLWDKLFGIEVFTSLTSRISDLAPWHNLNEILTVNRKWGGKIDVLWNIHKPKDQWSIFWSWIVISPIEIDWKLVADEGLVWDSFFNFEGEIDTVDDIFKPKDFFNF
jgi:PAS domain-containing protein